MNYKDLNMSSDTSSLKIFQEGTGTVTTANIPAAGSALSTATIPHTYGSDGLLFRVQATGFGWTTMIPWESNDGRTVLWGAIDSNNLYLYVETSDSSGLGHPPITVNYSYRIIIP